MSFSEVLLLIVIPVVAVLGIVWGIHDTKNLPSLDEQERANVEYLGEAYDRVRADRQHQRTERSTVVCFCCGGPIEDCDCGGEGSNRED